MASLFDLMVFCHRLMQENTLDLAVFIVRVRPTRYVATNDSIRFAAPAHPMLMPPSHQTNDTDGRLRGAQERIENQERALARRESRLAVLREAAIPWEERSEVDRKQLLMETLHEYEVKQRKAKAKVARVCRAFDHNYDTGSE